MTVVALGAVAHDPYVLGVKDMSHAEDLIYDGKALADLIRHASRSKSKPHHNSIPAACVTLLGVFNQLEAITARKRV